MLDKHCGVSTSEAASHLQKLSSVPTAQVPDKQLVEEGGGKWYSTWDLTRWQAWEGLEQYDKRLLLGKGTISWIQSEKVSHCLALVKGVGIIPFALSLRGSGNIAQGRWQIQGGLEDGGWCQMKYTTATRDQGMPLPAVETFLSKLCKVIIFLFQNI